MGQLWRQVKRSRVLKDGSGGSALTRPAPHPCQSSCTAPLGLAQSGLSTWHWPQGLTLPLSCLALLWIPCPQPVPFPLGLAAPFSRGPSSSPSLGQGCLILSGLGQCLSAQLGSRPSGEKGPDDIAHHRAQHPTQHEFTEPHPVLRDVWEEVGWREVLKESWA